MNRFGISQKMETPLVSNSTNDITLLRRKTDSESPNKDNLSDPESISSCEPEMQTLSLFGENLSMIAASEASTAQLSETKASISVPSLSDRLMQSLISAGLVKGITHTSIRKQSGAAIRASALWPLDGGVVDGLEAVCSSLSANER